MSPRRERAALLAVVALLAGRLRLAAGTGFVFSDLSGDGQREPGEPGLASVAVSNGVDVVLTDDKGFYRLPDRAGSWTFVIKPRGWRPPVDGSNLPMFHAKPASGGIANFPLVRSEEPDDLRALVLTDPQPSSATEVEYLSRGLVGRMGHKTGFAFGVTLGDVVYDRPDLFGAVNATLSGVGIPWYSLPGNHDLALGHPDEAAAVASFESVYGPSTYAFHAGPALFIALDDVRPIGGPRRFVGGLRADQFAFLGNLLKATPPEEWVVVMMHIPMFAPYPMGPGDVPARPTGCAYSACSRAGHTCSSFRATPIISATCCTGRATAGGGRNPFTTTMWPPPAADSGAARRVPTGFRSPPCGTALRLDMRSFNSMGEPCL